MGLAGGLWRLRALGAEQLAARSATFRGRAAGSLAVNTACPRGTHTWYVVGSSNYMWAGVKWTSTGTSPQRRFSCSSARTVARRSFTVGFKAESTPGGPPAGASISASKGGPYGCDGCYTLDVAVHNFPTGTYTYYCHDNSGSGGSDRVFYSHDVAVTDPNQSTWPGVFCYDSSPYEAYVVMNGVASNTVSFASP